MGTFIIGIAVLMRMGIPKDLEIYPEVVFLFN